MRIKDARIYTSRTGTYRDLEDWRDESVAKRHGPWATHCLDHDQIRWFFNYSKAKAWASSPDACVICAAFDRRCIYCPSSREEWRANPATGFTASAGHIMGNAVCFHHKYGPIPVGVDYLEVMNVVLGQPELEIFMGEPFLGTKAFGVAYQTGDQRFWLRSFTSYEYMTATSAASYHQALGFALAAMSHLNEQVGSQPDLDSCPRFFETWEELASRGAGKKQSDQKTARSSS